MQFHPSIEDTAIAKPYRGQVSRYSHKNSACPVLTKSCTHLTHVDKYMEKLKGEVIL